MTIQADFRAYLTRLKQSVYRLCCLYQEGCRRFDSGRFRPSPSPLSTDRNRAKRRPSGTNSQGPPAIAWWAYQVLLGCHLIGCRECSGLLFRSASKQSRRIGRPALTPVRNFGHCVITCPRCAAKIDRLKFLVSLERYVPNLSDNPKIIGILFFGFVDAASHR